jgi:hypothetical protein
VQVERHEESDIWRQALQAFLVVQSMLRSGDGRDQVGLHVRSVNQVGLQTLIYMAHTMTNTVLTPPSRMVGLYDQSAYALTTHAQH